MQERSTFVTVVGWLFIILSAIGMLQSLLFMFLPFDKLLPTAQVQPLPGQQVQDAQAFMRSIMHGMFIFMFVVETWVLLSSIGLVMRKGWARISFIIICAISTFFSVIYVLMGLLGRSMPMGQAPDVTPAMADAMHGMMTVMAVMGAVFSALFIFIIYKLSTRKIVQEFLPPPKE